MFIEVPEESTVGDDVADWYERQRNAWGYLPNYAPAFATRPDVAEAWNTLNNAVRGHMERRRFELATIAAARAYRSTYCMAAHCKFLRDACDDESTMRAVAADPSGADLDATDRAVMDFATLVARDASSITAADVQQLRDHGLERSRDRGRRARSRREGLLHQGARRARRAGGCPARRDVRSRGPASGDRRAPDRRGVTDAHGAVQIGG